MIKKSIYFFLVALIGSVIFASLASLFFSYKPLLVLLYSLGVAVSFLLFKGKVQFEKNSSAIVWIAIGCFLPVLYIGLVYLIGWQMLGHKIEPLSLTFLSSLPLVLIASFFEEVGWRGYLFSTLQKIGWLKMNFIIGILWSAWHLPAILMGSYDMTSPLFAGILIFIINVILLSFVFGWFRQKTAGIIAPTVIHAFHNLGYIYWTGKNDLSILGESGLVLTIVLLFLVIIILQAWKEPISVKSI
jgi:membrane protease YdiL (CAAX protease family)